ncbi:hypothetical protein [Paenibacillus koleovorans]|uniref:hypothetical protein n=1 Tax=Paenibacillus koleovorans TaxID=121608 RepID=UPI000FDB9D0C|nr:hypothetical protein [Paenibacillus koleovorans]
MYTALGIFASLIGLFVTGAALFVAWYVYEERRKGQEQGGRSGTGSKAEQVPENVRLLLQRWMIWDWAVVILFGLGAVFLFTDLLAVHRDLNLYPPYHYGYLLCGFIFCVLGMLFSFIRLATLIWLNERKAARRADHTYEPQHAYHAEERI